jgi:hypothetical protein
VLVAEVSFHLNVTASPASGPGPVTKGLPLPHQIRVIQIRVTPGRRSESHTALTASSPRLTRGDSDSNASAAPAEPGLPPDRTSPGSPGGPGPRPSQPAGPSHGDDSDRPSRGGIHRPCDSDPPARGCGGRPGRSGAGPGWRAGRALFGRPGRVNYTDLVLGDVVAHGGGGWWRRRRRSRDRPSSDGGGPDSSRKMWAGAAPAQARRRRPGGGPRQAGRR